MVNFIPAFTIVISESSSERIIKIGEHFVLVIDKIKGSLFMDHSELLVTPEMISKTSKTLGWNKHGMERMHRLRDIRL